MLCSRNFPEAKKFMDKRGGESTFSVEQILSQSAKKFVGEPFCAVFQKNSTSNKVFRQKVKSGENPDFPSKRFCITVPKILVRETLCAVFQKTSSSDKVF